jgi:hypothetical protein
LPIPVAARHRATAGAEALLSKPTYELDARALVILVARMSNRADNRHRSSSMAGVVLAARMPHRARRQAALQVATANDVLWQVG